MLPGWGGCFLLPNLVGADRAVEVIIENALSRNKMMTGAEVHDLASRTPCSTGPISWPARWTGPEVVTGGVTVERPEIDRGDVGRSGHRGRSFADSKVGGASPGPYKALELIAAAKTADRQSAYAAEDETLPT